RVLSEKVPYPLHLGVTEAGTPFSGSIKSAVGMGALLMDGIGDTMRVSLTADPVEEVKVAYEILKALGLRERGPVMIACPSCGRDNVGVQTLAETVEARLAEYPQHFEVAVLGCAVNGPGEAGDADFGIAGGRAVRRALVGRAARARGDRADARGRRAARDRGRRGGRRRHRVVRGDRPRLSPRRHRRLPLERLPGPRPRHGSDPAARQAPLRR